MEPRWPPPHSEEGHSDERRESVPSVDERGHYFDRTDLMASQAALCLAREITVLALRRSASGFAALDVTQQRQRAAALVSVDSASHGSSSPYDRRTLLFVLITPC